jgi:diguanylate cyclase (GGDEF)-like protein
MEAVFADLKKMDPQEALAHLDTVDGDEKLQEAVRSLRQHVFEDPMNPGIGNRYAYQEFRKKNVPGVWTSIDVNDLKHLNDTHGHEAGDALIHAFGGAARKGADPAKVKVFRTGGDEYAIHAPDPETAYSTVRSIRQHLDTVPPIAGTHNVTFSAGFGHDFETADRALYHAKAQKHTVGPSGEKIRAHVAGQVPHLAHSLIPGSEGPVPLENKSAQAPKLAPAVTPTTTTP